MPAAMIVREDTDLPTASWQKVNTTKLVASGVIRAKAANSGTVSMRWADDESNTVDLEAGASYQLVNVDLSKIELQGSAASQGYEFVGDTSRGVV